MFKVCCKCKLQKEFEQFSKHSKTKDGLQTMCKSCKKAYKIANKEKIAATDKEYYLANKDKLFEYQRTYRDQNKDKVLEYERNYREINKDRISERSKKYYEENKEAIALRAKNYYKANPDKVSARYKKHYVDNKLAYAVKCNKRRAMKKNAVPAWLTEEDHQEIKDFYEIAKMFKIYTGQTYHVDHIVPLQGKTVCGLHVPWNLQVISATENLSKSNKLQEDVL
jgi:hypothetical protein